MYLSMNEREEKLHTQVMEALLDYLEGQRTLRSVVALGITEHNRNWSPRNENLAQTLSQLNFIGNQIAHGENKKYSREYIKETFTTMLEELTKN